MSVLFSRIGTPVPGHQLEAIHYARARRDVIDRAYALHAGVYLRMGGPHGQLAMIESFEDLAALETMKRAQYAADVDHRIPYAPAGIFRSLEEQTWIGM